MIKIKNELEFRNWFRKNYRQLGYSKILRKDIGKFPDFIMLKNNKKIRVELETLSSNFIKHKHDISKVDEVVCIKKDINLNIRVIEVKKLDLIGNNNILSDYSIKSMILNLFKSNKILNTSEIALLLDINWFTAEKCLLELALDNKLERIKKLGTNLWLIKK